MSWSFGNVSSSAPGNGPQIAAGPDLPEVQTDSLGFLSLAGETKLRIVPPWPADQLPPPTASLLSIAPSQGLIAAAGPNTLAIASSDSVRRAYASDLPAENNVKPFTSQVTLDIPRVSQVAFSADESCLVIAAEQGGGLAVYDTRTLLQGQKDAAFQLATNGIPVRALAPNPAPDFSHLFAIVLDKGQLLLANLKDRQLVPGGNGQVFREGVSCVSWSARGKQLVVGLQDGSAAQFDHNGMQKAHIPPTVPSPMSSIYWLANDDFLTVNQPTSNDTTDSKIHIVHRDKSSGNFTSRALPLDPTAPMGQRLPSHYYINRLKGFLPSLEDVLILSSSAGLDVGLVTRSTSPLAADVPADKITNVYTLAGLVNDSRAAHIPMSSDGVGDSSPLGMILDLSAKETVKRPIPGLEVPESATPLPALMVLDIEGRLTSWWVVYNDSVLQKTAYPGLVHAVQTSVASSAPAFGASGNSASTPASAPAFASSQPRSTPAFGSSTFGQAPSPAFGAPSTPAFRGASTMGSKSSPWAGPAPQATSAFGKPAFGSASAFGASSNTPSFGAASGMANKQSPWGTSATQATTAFGQPSVPSGTATSGFAAFSQPGGSAFGASTGDKSAPSPFSAFGSSQPAASPFASAANKTSSPFGSAGQNASSKSPFSAAPSTSPGAGSIFGSAANTAKPSPFGSQAAGPASTFGQASTPMTGNGASKSIFESPDPGSGNGSATSIFGSNPSQQQTFSPEASMADDTTEAAKPSGAAFGAGSFKMASIFAEKRDGKTASQNEKPDESKAEAPSSSLFGTGFGAALSDAAKTPATPIKEEPQSPAADLPAVSMTPATPPRTSQEPESAPLPPDFAKTPAESPARSAPEEAPLPPDFVSKPADIPGGPESAPLPPDFVSSSSKTEEAPIAGSPPVDLGAASAEPPSVDGDDEPLSDDEHEVSDVWEEEDEDVVDEDDEDDDDDEEAVDDGESGVEVEDDDEDEDAGDHDNVHNQSTTPAGLKASAPSRPNTTSRTPGGLANRPVFAPPIKESPRSPSPIRETQTPASRAHTRKIILPVEKFSRRSSSLAKSQRPKVAKQPDPADLQDDEDERIKQILESPLVPNKNLESFVAHQDYVGSDEKQGLGGQIENVFRDINSMVDTLGLNARSLEAFVRGHEQSAKPSRSRSDLANEDDWCLVEIPALDRIESEIHRELDSGCVTEIRAKTSQIGDTQVETLRLRSRLAETRKQLVARTDPEKRTAQRNAAMDVDTEARRSQLRGAVQKMQKLLQQTEEALSVLRADLASLPPDGGTRRPVPTVEAVTKTILKMTAMVESKSGDVDVLEAQMRRLHAGIADLSLDDSEDMSSSFRSSMTGPRGNPARRTARGHPNPAVLPLSRSMNALATPRPARTAADGLGMSGMLGSRYGTPPISAVSATAGGPVLALPKSMSVMSLSSPLTPLTSALSGPLTSSAVASQNPAASAIFRDGAFGSFSPAAAAAAGVRRRTMADVTGQDVREFAIRREHRRKVLRALGDVVTKKGSRVVRVEESGGGDEWNMG